METRKLTCEICKNKCHLTAGVAEGEVLDVSENGCMRGYVHMRYRRWKKKIRELEPFLRYVKMYKKKYFLDIYVKIY